MDPGDMGSQTQMPTEPRQVMEMHEVSWLQIRKNGGSCGEWEISYSFKRWQQLLPSCDCCHRASQTQGFHAVQF